MLPDLCICISTVLITCIVVLIFILLKWRQNYFQNIGLPYIERSWTTIFKSFSISFLVDEPGEIYNEVRGGKNNIIGFFHSLLTPVVLVLEPNLVEKILIKDFSSFQDHGVEFDFSRDPLFQHLFHMKGDQWRSLRHMLLPAFTSGKLKGMLPNMVNNAQIIIDAIKQNANLRTEINLKQVLSEYSLAVIASVGFAIEPESFKDPKCEFRKISKNLNSAIMLHIRLFMLISFPKFSNFFGIKAFPHEVDEYYIRLTKEALNLRMKSGLRRNDFIQLLLELKDKGSVQIDQKDLEEDEKIKMKEVLELGSTNKNLEISDGLLASQVFVFLAAGYDAMAYLAAITVYLLSKHKDIQQKVRDEVRKAKDKHGGISYQSLKDMQLLDASMSEALRLFPPTPILLRECTKDYTLSNGQIINKGMRVVIPARALQNDTRFWENPEQFNPERFLNDGIHSGSYIPFGYGPRLCIGQRIAQLVSKVLLAELVDNFELLPSKKTREPIKINIVITADAVGGLWGILKPIEKK